MKIEDDRKLIKVEIHNQGTTWTLQWSGGYKVFSGSEEDFRKYLISIKASDSETLPKSTRNKKYKDIVDDIKKGRTRHVWVWKHKMKESTLNERYEIYHKNYFEAIDEVLEYVEREGYKISPDELTRVVTFGPKKPSEGKTNEFMLFLYNQNNEPAMKGVRFQVYGMRTQYELNMYLVPLKRRDYEQEGAVYQEKASKKTAKCPNCGNKYLVATGYCLTCKKKVGKTEKKKESFTLQDSVRIPGTDIILEAGDTISVFTEENIQENRGLDYYAQAHPGVGQFVVTLSEAHTMSDETDFTYYGSFDTFEEAEQRAELVLPYIEYDWSTPRGPSVDLYILDQKSRRIVKYFVRHNKAVRESVKESSKKLTIDDAESLLKNWGVSHIIVDGKSEKVIDTVQKDWGTYYVTEDSFDEVDFQTILSSIGIRKADITYNDHNYPPSITVYDSELSRRGNDRRVTFQLGLK